jgi:hypothetical protein
MTTADVLALVRRRWYVVLLALLVTVLALQAVRDARPVYWAEAEVTLLSPPAPGGPNELTTSTQGLVAMAGLVVADVQAGEAQPAVSDSVDLPGLGVRDGWNVRLPNVGGQWEPNFDRPVVDVQVVAATPSEASARLAGLVADVQRALDDRQAADGVPPVARIRTASVEHVQVVRVDGSRSRAAVMVLLLGLAGSVVAAQLVDAALRRRRRADAAGSGSDLGAVLVPDVAAPHVPVA